MQFSSLTTPGGYTNGEVTSALQKCIRRGEEENALFWMTELSLAGYGNYVWKRLRIMASEDIGIANSDVCVQIRTLNENWTEQRKNKEDRSLAERLFLVHAVMILARAEKSRRVDNALMVFYEGERPKREIPDVALDMHTQRGRKKGRGVQHFFEEGAKLNPVREFGSPPSDERSARHEPGDPYRERAFAARSKKKHQPSQDALDFE